MDLGHKFPRDVTLEWEERAPPGARRQKRTNGTESKSPRGFPLALHREICAENSVWMLQRGNVLS